MQKLVIEKFGPDKVAELKDVDDIYAENYEKDCESIDKFCEDLSEKQLKNDTEFNVTIDNETGFDKKEEMLEHENNVTLCNDSADIKINK